MKILIVGGAGYIGSHVAREFLDAGHAVTVYDNLSTGTRENLFAGEGFVEGDILDFDALRNAMAGGFDALVHLAAAKAAGESMLKPEKYSLQNLSGTVNILNAALETGIRRIVFSSSAATYGEPRYLPIDEKHPTEPENYYGFTKLEIERILAWYDRLKGMRYAALRYFNAAGYDPEGRIHGLEKNPANLLPVIMEVAAGMRSDFQVFRHGLSYAGRHRGARLRARQRPRRGTPGRSRLDIAQRPQSRRQPGLRERALRAPDTGSGPACVGKADPGEDGRQASR